MRHLYCVIYVVSMCSHELLPFMFLDKKAQCIFRINIQVECIAWPVQLKKHTNSYLVEEEQFKKVNSLFQNNSSFHGNLDIKFQVYDTIIKIFISPNIKFSLSFMPWSYLKHSIAPSRNIASQITIYINWCPQNSPDVRRSHHPSFKSKTQTP